MRLCTICIVTVSIGKKSVVPEASVPTRSFLRDREDLASLVVTLHADVRDATFGNSMRREMHRSGENHEQTN